MNTCDPPISTHTSTLRFHLSRTWFQQLPHERYSLTTFEFSSTVETTFWMNEMTGIRCVYAVCICPSAYFADAFYTWHIIHSTCLCLERYPSHTRTLFHRDGCVFRPGQCLSAVCSQEVCRRWWLGGSGCWWRLSLIWIPYLALTPTASEHIYRILLWILWMNSIALPFSLVCGIHNAKRHERLLHTESDELNDEQRCSCTVTSTTPFLSAHPSSLIPFAHPILFLSVEFEQCRLFFGFILFSWRIICEGSESV